MKGGRRAVRTGKDQIVNIYFSGGGVKTESRHSRIGGETADLDGSSRCMRVEREIIREQERRESRGCRDRRGQKGVTGSGRRRGPQEGSVRSRWRREAAPVIVT